MRVKVNEAYKGTYGLYDPKLNTVYAKHAGDEFELSPELAYRHIEKGVLVALEEAKEETKKEVKSTVAGEKSKKMTYPELKEAAKARGISYVGKKAKDLEKLIEEYDATQGDAPLFDAGDAVL